MTRIFWERGILIATPKGRNASWELSEGWRVAGVVVCIKRAVSSVKAGKRI